MEPTLEWDVVVVGCINTDYLIRGRRLPGPGMSLSGGVFRETPGGKGANAAVAAARLGARTAIIGRVGHDARGTVLLDHLTRAGVHMVHVSVDDPAPTGAAVIHLDEQGQKQTLAALWANLHLTAADVQAAADTIRATRVLVAQLDVPVECVRAAARLARATGVRVILDPAPPQTLPDGCAIRKRRRRARHDGTRRADRTAPAPGAARVPRQSGERTSRGA